VSTGVAESVGLRPSSSEPSERDGSEREANQTRPRSRASAFQRKTLRTLVENLVADSDADFGCHRPLCHFVGWWPSGDVRCRIDETAV
jgi:hypothetical protein